MGLSLGLKSGLSSMATSPETLATLFAGGAQGAWYDPSDTSTLYSSEAGTGAVAVGGTVGFMRDKSGNGNHLIQGTAGLRPTLRQAGTQYYLEFASDALASATGLTLEAGSNFFCALRADAGEETWVTLWGDAAGNAFVCTAQNGSVGTAYDTAGTPTHWVDGVQVGTATTRDELFDAIGAETPRIVEARTADMSAWDRLNLFGYTGAFHFSGRFYGALLVPDLSAANRTLVNTFLAGKSGASL
jgi:hypothetical protein